MKCPFRKIIKSHQRGDYTTTEENFADCYKAECPFYSEHNSYLITNDGSKSSVRIVEVCNRTTLDAGENL